MSDEILASTYPATQCVHTPKGPVNCRDSHAEKLRGIMAFLGAHTNTVPAPEGALCKNCANEAIAKSNR